jgi:CubicO group peptidase (beta-lactamase class C family)
MQVKRQVFIVAFTILSLLNSVAACHAGDLTSSSQTSGSSAAISNSLTKRIDDLVLNKLTALKIPGYALAVIKNGNVVVNRGYGVTNLETQQPVTSQTVFGLASLTKTFTALCLLTLVDQNKLALEDTLDKFIPDLPASYKKLTIRQLASMTAGVPKEVPQEVKWHNQLSILTRMPLAFEPGTDYVYSNFSYRLLGDVIEKVSGEKYFRYLTNQVLAPLGMNSTGTTDSLSYSGQVAQAYADNMGKGPVRKVQYKDPEVTYSAGMLASSLDDMLKYVNALMEHRILSKEAYQTYWWTRPNLPSGKPSRWAFGWASENDPEFGGARVISMNGGTPGVASTIILLPEQKSAVIALCNLRKPPSYSIARAVARLAFSSGSTNDASATTEVPAEQGADEEPKPSPQL